jgi:hypothetical protein
MDSSLQSANLRPTKTNADLTAEELGASLAAHGDDVANDAGSEEREHHIHLPNPSLWPLLLSASVLIAVIGILFFPDTPWLTIVAVPLVLIGILGWALEDPMKPTKPLFYKQNNVASPFLLGQEVIDKDNYFVGKIGARFNKYILVERGGLVVKAFYVPQRVAKSDPRKGLVQLSVSEDELVAQGYNSVPDDLYGANEDTSDSEQPLTRGVPQFARGPLSPAETGHYNYGPNFPGMNTDASGSYLRDEVRPSPQRYVSDRRKFYKTDKTIPPRATNPE